MLGLHLPSIVLVALVAGVAAQAIGMAHPAVAGALLSMINREGMRLIEGCRKPGRSCVAGITSGCEDTLVEGWICVAGGACLGSPRIDFIHMAIQALNVGVGAVERESRQGMVEFRSFPGVS